MEECGARKERGVETLPSGELCIRSEPGQRDPTTPDQRETAAEPRGEPWETEMLFEPIDGRIERRETENSEDEDDDGRCGIPPCLFQSASHLRQADLPQADVTKKAAC